MTKLGVVYTPPEVAGPMVELALAPLTVGKTPDQILALSVYDPAVGEGAFLIEVIRVLSKALSLNQSIGCDLKREIAARCLRGTDIDPAAIAAARRVVERYVGAPVPELQDHLRVGNALMPVTAGAIDPSESPTAATAWPVHDAIIGNPPYIRQERLGAAKRELRGFASYHGLADLYVYFVELAHRVVRPGGRYCLIVPNKWMSARYGQPLRNFLARASSVERIVDFGGGVFADAHAFPCIIAGTVGGARSQTIDAKRAISIPVADALAQIGVPHARASWGAAPWHIDGRADRALATSIAAKWPLLGEAIGLPSRGIVTGCNRAFVIDEAMRDALGDTPLVRPFLKGRDIRRWRPAAIDRYVIAVGRGVVPPPAVLAHLARFRGALEPGSGRKPGTYKWYELQDPIIALAASRQARLFYQDIQAQPACCLDEDGEFAPDTTVWVLPTDDRFVLAVLNSRLYGWYSRRRFPPALNGAVRPKRAYMSAFPLAVPPDDLRSHIANLVASQLAEPNPSRDLAIDDLVCEAYRLTRRQRAAVAAMSPRAAGS